MSSFSSRKECHRRELILLHSKEMKSKLLLQNCYQYLFYLTIQRTIAKMSILKILPHFKFKNFQWKFQRSSWNHVQASQPASEQKLLCLAITVQRFVWGRTGANLAFTEEELQLLCLAWHFQMEEGFLPIISSYLCTHTTCYTSSNKWVYFSCLQVQRGEKMTDNVTPVP